MTPLDIDVRRVGKLADECDRLDAAKAPFAERCAAYDKLARACDLAHDNARRMGQ